MSQYETDIVLWSEHQADLLRRRAAGELANEKELDWLNLAEEIESFGRSERRELRARVRTIIEHLARLELSPNSEPRQGWIETIQRTRNEISDLLADSPSLAATVDAMVSEQLGKGLRAAARTLPGDGETPTRPVADLRYSSEQVIGPWLP